jgi:hypothetical protein
VVSRFRQAPDLVHPLAVITVDLRGQDDTKRPFADDDDLGVARSSDGGGVGLRQACRLPA